VGRQEQKAFHPRTELGLHKWLLKNDGQSQRPYCQIPQFLRVDRHHHRHSPHDWHVHAPAHPFTNGFSKKLENQEAAIALHFMDYNFACIHQTLQVAPAMEVGISDHVWTLEEIINLLGNCF